MEKLILYTGTNCPHCGRVRKLLREFAASHSKKEGVDFVEKLIDGEKLQPGEYTFDGIETVVVSSEDEVADKAISTGKNVAVANKDVFFEALQRQIASTPSIYYKGKILLSDNITESSLQELFQ